MKVYSLTVRNRFTATLLALAVLGAGAALLVVGICAVGRTGDRRGRAGHAVS